MAFYFNAGEGGQISREDWIRVAHAHGVPAFNDAAADVPPIANLWNYTKMGFDLVAFSGGKGIRGPQNAGLLLGRKDLIASGHANNVPTDRAIGRGMKVAKEQIVGMVAAVDWFLAQDEGAMRKEWEARAAAHRRVRICVPSLTHDVLVPPVANNVPHLRLRYDRRLVSITPLERGEGPARGHAEHRAQPRHRPLLRRGGPYVRREHHRGRRLDAGARRGHDCGPPASRGAHARVKGLTRPVIAGRLGHPRASVPTG